MPTKLITCAYCGNQELVRLAEGERLQLVCTACGAGSKGVKVLPGSKPVSVLRPEPDDSRSPKKPAKYREKTSSTKYQSQKKKSEKKYDKKRRKRKKDLKYWIKKIKDEIEDIFD